MDDYSHEYARLAYSPLADFGDSIVTHLSDPKTKVYFPVIKPPVEEITTLIAALRSAITGGDSSEAVARREQAGDELVAELTLLAGFLEIEADGDPVKLASTGFRLKKKPGGRATAELPRPANARAKHGQSTEIILQVDPSNNAYMYEGQFCLDPLKGEWKSIAPVSNSRKILFIGLERGKDYFFRARALGAGKPSDWSDIVTIMVI